MKFILIGVNYEKIINSARLIAMFMVISLGILNISSASAYEVVDFRCQSTTHKISNVSQYFVSIGVFYDYNTSISVQSINHAWYVTGSGYSSIYHSDVNYSSSGSSSTRKKYAGFSYINGQRATFISTVSN